MARPFLALIISCALLTSCTKDKGNDTTQVLKGNATSIEAPASVTVGQKLDIAINFTGGNDGCAHPDHLEYTENSKIITVSSFYNYPTKPRTCTQVFPIHKLNFEFTPVSPGNYIIKADAVSRTFEAK